MKAAGIKKQKCESGKNATSYGNINFPSMTFKGHYSTFTANALDTVDCHEEFKSHYLSLGNASIHIHNNI